MLKHSLLTAWRHIENNRLFSGINVLGLSLGLASVILIVLFVRDEVAWDTFLPDADRIVRMHTAYYSNDAPPFLTVRSAGRMMEAVRDQAAPDLVETGVRLLQVDVTMILEDKVFNENVVFADATMFDVFDLPLLHGDAASAFSKPMDLVITASMATKYFGRTDVVGERLTVCCLQGEAMDVTITGVMEDLPHNSHLAIDFLVWLDPPMFDFAPNLLNTWTSVNTYTYFKLVPEATPADLKARVDRWLDEDSPLRERMPEGMKTSDMLHMNFMPVPDIHLDAWRDAGNMGDFRALGDARMVFAFSGIALLVLVIAAINFMNLSTARASRRAREVALRKVMGASRWHVAAQFLGEAVSVALISLLFALVAVEVVLPGYNTILDRELQFVVSEDLGLLGIFIAIAVLLGLVSGSYPALYLSRFLPARVLKSGQTGDGSGQGRIRTILVVFQFTISIGLAACALIIHAQTTYARSLDVGYTYANKLVLSGLASSGARDQQQAIVNELRRIPGVTGVALSSEAPSQDNENNTGFRLLDGPADTMDENVILNIYSVGFGFFEDYGMRMIAGRTFDESRGSDQIQLLGDDSEEIGQASVVINESAARRLGFGNPADAVGKTLRAGVFMAGDHDLTIVGVAEDVYFRSIKFGIRPSVFFNHPRALRVATISFDTPNVAGLVAAVDRVWKEMVPLTPVEREFLSEMMHAQYNAEEGQARLFAAFSALAVVIACLGLYGLASFTAERRTREIGLRKVMGARIRDIVTLLVWQFSLPVVIANVIAWPIAWLFMSRWLDRFSYRLDDSAILLAAAAAGGGALVIAWLTVASRAIRVANASPIDALRYE